jgi:hypothetical protein
MVKIELMMGKRKGRLLVSVEKNRSNFTAYEISGPPPEENEGLIFS